MLFIITHLYLDQSGAVITLLLNLDYLLWPVMALQDLRSCTSSNPLNLLLEMLWTEAFAHKVDSLTVNETNGLFSWVLSSLAGRSFVGEVFHTTCHWLFKVKFPGIEIWTFCMQKQVLNSSLFSVVKCQKIYALWILPNSLFLCIAAIVLAKAMRLAIK